MERTIITIIFVAVSLFVPFDGEDPQHKVNDSTKERVNLISYEQHLEEDVVNPEIIQ